MHEEKEMKWWQRIFFKLLNLWTSPVAFHLPGCRRKDKAEVAPTATPSTHVHHQTQHMTILHDQKKVSVYAAQLSSLIPPYQRFQLQMNRSASDLLLLPPSLPLPLPSPIICAVTLQGRIEM